MQIAPWSANKPRKNPRRSGLSMTLWSLWLARRGFFFGHAVNLYPPSVEEVTRSSGFRTTGIKS